MTALKLLAALALLFGNGFFVAAEFAAVSVRRAQLEPLVDAGSKRAVKVLDALRHLSLLLAGAQLGITLCSLGLGAVAEPAVAVLFEDLFHALHVPDSLTHPIAFAIALALVVLLHMVIGEMVPKNISLASSERAALVLVPALDWFVRVTRPVIGSLNAMANGTLRLLGIEPQDELKAAYTPDELADILAESRSEGYLDAGQHQRLATALTFGDRTAGDVIVPSAEVVTIGPETTADEVQQAAAATSFSRFPVRADGRLLGFVHVKDAMVSPTEGREFTAEHLRPMPDVPVDMPLPDVLATLRRARSHMGNVVADGRSVGVVALEDVVEEVVGEITDTAHTS